MRAVTPHRLALLAAAVLLALLAVELSFGFWLGGDPLAGLSVTRNGTWRYDVTYPGIAQADRDVLYRRDRFGFRGSYPDVSRIDLLVVGGSTAAQRFVSEDKTWLSVLKRNLASNGLCIGVANAAFSGRSTFGHLEEFKHWFPRIPRLHADYIMLYVGATDMFLDAPNDVWDRVFKDHPWRLKEIVRDHSAFYRWFREYAGPYIPKPYDLSFLSLDFENNEWVTKPARTGYAALLAPRVAAYRDRLGKLLQLTRAMGAVPILVTQDRGDSRLTDDGVVGLERTHGRTMQSYNDKVLGRLDQSHMNGVDYYRILSVFNRATLEVCRANGAVCVDQAKEVRFEVGDFSDHAHLTSRGSRKLGEYLAQRLESLFSGRRCGTGT
jgi:lysophospholipase L1-like esterase